jgi:endonuclease/exonuclease/phosphatase family metal-dependent hydrolase
MTPVKRFEMHVLSYNMHKGFSPWNRDFVLSQIRSQVRELGADLVFLQEVMGRHEGHAKKWDGWPKASQFEYLADEMWHHHAYGQNAIYDEGDHGNAILSKFPFEHWKNVDISAARWDRRGFIHGVVHVPKPDTRIHVINTHLGLLESFRRRQVSDLLKHIHKTVPPDAPLIVAGDFNDWRERISHILNESCGLEEVFLKLSGKHARSFPSYLPFFHLDRIYTRGFAVKDAKCYQAGPWASLSDHLPMFARLLLE